jgi:hypothetical protein
MATHPQHGPDGLDANAQKARAQKESERKRELLEFRDAGVLTEAELEEQMAKFRWGIP